MIEILGLYKRFEDQNVLENLDMHVARGSVYGLVGPNGVGKSTLIRLITGALIPDQGTITIDGEPVWENEAVKARIGYVADDFYYFPQASLLDMKTYYRKLYPDFDETYFNQLLSCFPELELKKPMRKYSKGMVKQAALVLALTHRPDVLILDEPVDGLDPVMRKQMWSLALAEVAERDMTVLVSSHNLRELEDVCDHIGVLSRGRLIFEKSIDEISGNLEQTFMEEMGGENYAVKNIF